MLQHLWTKMQQFWTRIFIFFSCFIFVVILKCNNLIIFLVYLYFWCFYFWIGMSSWRCSRLPFKRLTGNNIIGPLFSPFISIPFFSSVTTISQTTAAWIKILFHKPKLKGVHKILGLDPFSDHVGHFGAPWQPFCILQVVWRCRWVSHLLLGWYLTLTLEFVIISSLSSWSSSFLRLSPILKLSSSRRISSFSCSA